MSTFNKKVWMRRARNNLARRLTIGDPKAKDNHAKEYAAILGIEKLAEWANAKGLEIIFSKMEGGLYHEISKKIMVSSKGGPITQLCVLLHECGHFIITRSGGRNRYPDGYAKIEEGREGRNVHHKMDVIAEEFDAWIKGWTLAHRLNIIVDRNDYNEVRSKYLKTYFKWALRRGRVADD
jgi:hypothetical protein